MSIDMYVSSSRAQASSVKAMCQKQIQGYRQLQQAINQFVMSSGELQGKTYDSAKQYFSAVLSPLAKGGMLLAEATAKACQKFPDDYQSQVDSGDLKSSELEEQIQQYQKGIDTANSIMRDISSSSLPEPAKKIVLKSIKNVKDGQEKAKKKLDKKLKKLKAFHASSPSIFSEISALESAVNTGAAQAATCWNGSSGTFSMPKDMSWTETIENKAFEKKYAIERPKEMSDKEYQVYLTKLRAQEKDLRVEDGWDKSAIKEYFKAANQQTRNLTAAEAMKKVVELYGQTRLAGSDLFIKMWNAWDSGTSQIDAERKLNVLLKIVQVTTTLPNDPKAVADLLSRFDKNLAPDNAFWRDLANEVQKAFPEPSLLTGDFGKQINNLRYVVSAQQAQYVRDNFKGATDQEKLAQFLSGCKDYNLWESDRLHHKKANEGQGDWPDGYEEGNIKVVVDFNTEFILNGKGRFQNIIDPEGSSQNGIVNGASFNYANRNDYDSKNKNDPKSVHGRLDVNIGKVDPDWRKQTVENGGLKYLAPDKNQFKDSSNDDSSTDKKSVEELSNDRKKKFEDEIRILKREQYSGGK
ncbi:DUF3114 domain-containing protein [Enterococcus sp. AZ196]|uniref:DUF3114 domain-containing protein n=1 Tax=Enterococcus sp. AZ196 TaxID=2774659 RepID=UPI003D272284